MKSIFKILSISVLALGLVACDNVPAGFVGVQVNKYGGDKGVDFRVKQPGKHLQEWNVDTFLFPTFTQTKVWDNNPPVDESFEFQSEGMTIRTNVGVTYHIKPEDAPTVFQKYRKGMDEITEIFLRAMIRDTLSTLGPEYKADEVHTTKRGELELRVGEIVKTRAAESGISIERVYFVGGMTLPKQVVDSINRKVEATQNAQTKQNELESTKAETQKVIEAARGEAEAIAIKGAALRKNPEILQQLAIEKWDGAGPSVIMSGNAAPIIQVPQVAAK